VLLFPKGILGLIRSRRRAQTPPRAPGIQQSNEALEENRSAPVREVAK
jgi:hypothetical protein